MNTARHMVAGIVTLASKLGHEPFTVARHDRGALVAIRAGLGNPRRSSISPPLTYC
jgi:pimeloyl-ACP methyl ester carboxylesterase